MRNYQLTYFHPVILNSTSPPSLQSTQSQKLPQTRGRRRLMCHRLILGESSPWTCTAPAVPKDPTPSANCSSPLDIARAWIYCRPLEHLSAKIEKCESCLHFCQLIFQMIIGFSLTNVSLIGSSNVLKSGAPGALLFTRPLDVTVISPSTSVGSSSNIWKLSTTTKDKNLEIFRFVFVIRVAGNVNSHLIVRRVQPLRYCWMNSYSKSFTIAPNRKLKIFGKNFQDIFENFEIRITVSGRKI